MHKFSENIKYNVGLMTLSTAATTATVTTGTSVDMAKYNNFAGLVAFVCATASGNLNVYIRQSTDAAVWTSTYLSSATIASCTVPYVGAYGSIECRAEQMSDGYRYLRVEAIPLTSTGGHISMDYLRFNSRYPSDSLPT